MSLAKQFPHQHGHIGHPIIADHPKLNPNSISSNEIHSKYNHHATPVNNVALCRLHFHLAGFVDIDVGESSFFHLTLLFNVIKQSSFKTKGASLNNSSVKNSEFIVHWMNNKCFNFNITGELFSLEIKEKLKKNQPSNDRKNSFNEQDEIDEQDLEHNPGNVKGIFKSK